MVRFPTKKSKTSGVVFLIGIDIDVIGPNKNMGSILIDSRKVILMRRKELQFTIILYREVSLEVWTSLLSRGTSHFKTLYSRSVSVSMTMLDASKTGLKRYRPATQEKSSLDSDVPAKTNDCTGVRLSLMSNKHQIR